MADDGYFPRGSSLLRRVHEERAVGLLYGQRALGIGAIAPLNFIGTLRHTRAPDKPFQRLVHTAKAVEKNFFGASPPPNFLGPLPPPGPPTKPFQRPVHPAKAFETIFFGTRPQADAVLAAVRRLHDGVHGQLPEAAGPFATGTPYSAFDPELML